MGISSDGMLYFGFTVGEDEEPPEWLVDNEETMDFDDYVCKLAGLPKDSKYEQRKPIIDACPVELHLYCSYDCPMYILSPKGCSYLAYRGYVVEVHSLHVDQPKIDALKNWCERNNIEYKEPKWLLCSMYG